MGMSGAFCDDGGSYEQCRWLDGGVDGMRHGCQQGALACWSEQCAGLLSTAGAAAGAQPAGRGRQCWTLLCCWAAGCAMGVTCRCRSKGDLLGSRKGRGKSDLGSRLDLGAQIRACGLRLVVCCPAAAADLEAQQRKGRGAPAWLRAEEMAALVAAAAAAGCARG